LSKPLLMVAFHFPPLAGSSGIQRTLRFARYLPEFGWNPIILTAHPRAYQMRSDDQLADIADNVEVIRAQAWDSSRHFAIAGRYPRFLARPDRWRSWWLGAMPAGLRAIRKLKPAAIWSTYPIPTAHQIGGSLAKRSGLPWIADFRDPMAQDGYPSDPATWQSFARIERHTMALACMSTFTTPGAAGVYRERYPDQAERVHLIENGYDEESFAGSQANDVPLNPGCITLVHSGVVYPKARDPSELFSALGQLKKTTPELYQRLRVRFRAAVHESLLHDLARKHGVEDAIETLPPIAYRDALEEMLRADGLLVLQASNCNEQVPAKLYEYFRARRPLIVLTDPAGDTAQVARTAGVNSIVPLDSSAAIAELLRRFVQNPAQGAIPSEEAIIAASRRQRTAQLAKLLDEAAN